MGKPPQKPSDEADQNQLDMAQKEGEAYQASLEYMANEVADNGATKQEGDYIVGLAQERAEGMYMLEEPGKLSWKEPGDKNCHIEVSVSDRADKRFIPGLSIKATLESAEGKKIGPFKVPFLWHPGLYHYGANIKVPGDGKYTVTVEIAPPDFMRHDKINGQRYKDAVTVEFKNFAVKAGQE